jgi:hypothetical protein
MLPIKNLKEIKMTSTNTLIRQGRNDEIWTKYCGFFDLSLDEFMKIQERLLMEQIELLSKSMMGRMLMGDMIPKNMEEFRQVVPLTTYEDYLGYLDQKREDVLPRKPHGWSHTSGRSGKYKYKWVPYPKKMYDKLGEILIATMILSTCSTKGEVNLELNDKVLLATAPPPYVTSFLRSGLFLRDRECSCWNRRKIRKRFHSNRILNRYAPPLGTLEIDQRFRIIQDKKPTYSSKGYLEPERHNGRRYRYGDISR